MGPNSVPETYQIPTPLTTAAVIEIHSRGCSPRPNDAEATELRHYNPTVPDIDGQLAFPDMEHVSIDDVDQEDLAHHEIQQDVVDEVVKLVTELEYDSLFPPFSKLRIPPARVINAWTQLYFEHFHPVLPILNKPAFSSSSTHWLLIFIVSAIGAQVSQLPQSQTCARAMHEMIRRLSMYSVCPIGLGVATGVEAIG
jgi:hypothetical protein